ncbi:MAG: tyrosine-type recombinase/integrase [Hyphomonadaceae bacterium]|nr:tyrosine-type recombinase/integrase [Hyphomonadaceae bacterium]
MTVTARKTAHGQRFRYDFAIDGQRYGSKAIYTTKREATRAEKEHRARVERGEVELPLDAKPATRTKGGRLTLAGACDQFWRDVAQHHRSAADIRRRLEHCKRLIGAETPLADIRFAVVNEAVQKRRAEKNARGQPMSNGGVNRDLIDQLRPVLNHAARVHELELPRIDWKALRLKEAGELVCEYSEAEITGWLRELRDPAERLYLATALTYGARRGELYFDHASLDVDAAEGPELNLGRYLSRDGLWRESRKDGSLHTVALDPGDAAALAAQRERAKAAGCAHLWVDQSGVEITYWAMGWRLRAAAARAGIAKARIIHGARHHAATAIMRATEGSLVHAQKLLGHRQITTTSRYAHLTKGDQRAALAKRGRVLIPGDIGAPGGLDTAASGDPGAAKSTPEIHARSTPALSR